MLTFTPAPYLMKNKIQHYPWGTRGKAAFIPNLMNIPVTPGEAYAELWMGTHRNGPSELMSGNSYCSLEDMIKSFPVQMMGDRLSKKYNQTFPFLLKILSAGEALSIQAHPDKSQAEYLHKHKPSKYPDNHHKPEVAIALDNLTALAGLKDYEGVLKTITKYPEIADLAENPVSEAFRKNEAASEEEKQRLVETFIKTLLNTSDTRKPLLSEAIKKIKEKIGSEKQPLSEEETLFLELEKKYGDQDIGLLLLFLLRMVHLKEGEGLFLKPGIPHAYLEGNIIECMANSDNVVRAGLTPKFKDTKTLIDIMDYDTKNIPIIKSDPEKEEFHYQTPADEFQISKLTLPSGKKRQLQTDDVPAILLVTKGEFTIFWQENVQKNTLFLRQGESVFIPAALGEWEMRPMDHGATGFLAKAS